MGPNLQAIVSWLAVAVTLYILARLVLKEPARDTADAVVRWTFAGLFGWGCMFCIYAAAVAYWGLV